VNGAYIRRPACPHCRSGNVTPASGKKFLITLIGGVLGGVLTGLIMSSDKAADKRASVGSIIFGIFTGGTAGFKYGAAREDSPTEKSYLCLNCFKFFTQQPELPEGGGHVYFEEGGSPEGGL